MPGLIPLHRLLADIDDDPIAGGKLAQKRHDLGVRSATYESSVSAGALYRKLKGSKAFQTAFYALPFWEGGNTRDPKHLNKHCHQFVYGAREGSEGKRAEEHASATQSYYDDESKTLDQILEALKKGGFDGLKKAAPAQKNRQKNVEADARKHSSAEDGAKGANVEENPAHTKASSDSGSDSPKPNWPKMTKEEIFDHLLVKMEPEELVLFLADESEVGDRYLIEVKREDAKGVLVWRATAITRMADEA